MMELRIQKLLIFGMYFDNVYKVHNPQFFFTY